MFILMEPIGFLVIISLKSRFTADFLIIKIGCKKQDGRPEDGIFQDGSKIRSTDGKISNFLKIHNKFSLMSTKALRQHGSTSSNVLT